MLVALLPQLLLYGTLPLWVVTMGAGLMLLHWATAAVAAAAAAAAAAVAAAVAAAATATAAVAQCSSIRPPPIVTTQSGSVP